MLKKFKVLSIDCDWVLTLKHQTELFSFLVPILNNHNKIFFSYMHHDINKYFNLDFEECDLVNIDHHHDAGYDVKKTSLHEGNWLNHLLRIFPKKINYHWICNTDSEPVKWGEYLPLFYDNVKSYSFDYEINKVKNENYDLIFICCSPEYNVEVGVTTYKILENIYGT